MNMLGFLRRRSEAYKALFRSDNPVLQNHAEVVLRDLAKFCNHRKPSIRVSNGAIDVHATMVAEGRREVYLRIQAQLGVSDDDLREIAGEQTND